MRPTTTVRWVCPSLLVAALAFAACDASAARADTVSPAAFVSCAKRAMTNANYKASTNADDVDMTISDANAGIAYVDWRVNDVSLGFWRSDNDAKRSYDSTKMLAKAMDTDVSDILSREGHVVVSFSNTPSKDEKAMVKDCLSHGKTSKKITPPLPKYPAEYVQTFTDACRKPDPSDSARTAFCTCVVATPVKWGWPVDRFLRVAKLGDVSPDFRTLVAACKK